MIFSSSVCFCSPFRLHFIGLFSDSFSCVAIQTDSHTHTHTHSAHFFLHLALCLRAHAHEFYIFAFFIFGTFNDNMVGLVRNQFQSRAVQNSVACFLFSCELRASLSERLITGFETSSLSLSLYLSLILLVDKITIHTLHLEQFLHDIEILMRTSAPIHGQLLSVRDFA